MRFRHEVENSNFAYGISGHRRGDRDRQDVSLVEDTDFMSLIFSFVEYNFSPKLKVRFEVNHLNKDARTFDKTFYDGHIADGIVRRIDVQDYKVEIDYFLGMQMTS